MFCQKKRGLPPNKINALQNTGESFTECQPNENIQDEIDINDIWIGNIRTDNQIKDSYSSSLGIHGKQVDVVLDSGAVDNILDSNTANAVLK